MSRQTSANKRNMSKYHLVKSAEQQKLIDSWYVKKLEIEKQKQIEQLELQLEIELEKELEAAMPKNQRKMSSILKCRIMRLKYNNTKADYFSATYAKTSMQAAQKFGAAMAKYIYPDTDSFEIKLDNGKAYRVARDSLSQQTSVEAPLLSLPIFRVCEIK